MRNFLLSKRCFQSLGTHRSSTTNLFYPLIFSLSPLVLSKRFLDKIKIFCCQIIFVTFSFFSSLFSLTSSFSLLFNHFVVYIKYVFVFSSNAYSVLGENVVNRVAIIKSKNSDILKYFSIKN